MNGTYASEHHWLLTEVLRDEWGFGGVVVSDWGAVHDRVAALRGGLDLEMPPAERGQRPAAAAAAGGWRLAAGQSVAVIGEFARTPRTPRYQGAGSSQVNPTRLDVPLDELGKAFGPAVDVRFAPGFEISGGEDDDALRDEAVALAGDCDLVVVFLGLPAAAESEGFDRTHIELPANQLRLVDALAGFDTPLVVVLAKSSVVQLSTWEHRVAAILECWLSGQAAGAEVVQVYVRDVESSARRPVRELAGFAKVALQAGESRTTTLELAERAFASWSTRWGRWAVEAGDFEIAVGTSSRNLTAARTVTLDAPSLALPLGSASTLHEWLAEEKGRVLLLALEPAPPTLRDPELISVIGTMPMETLAAFQGMGVDHATLQRLLNEL